jgi:hypothetical protein
VLVGVFWLVGTGVSSASAAPASLSGEGFFVENFQIGGSCDPSGTSTVTFSGTGSAGGPYPGTATESGSITYGPQTIPTSGFDAFGEDAGPTLSVNVQFSITSGDTTIVGTKSGVVSNGSDLGACGTFQNARYGGFTGIGTETQVISRTNYSATITTDSGRYSDSGQSDVLVNNLNVNGVQDSTGNFGSTAAGSLSEFFFNSNGVEPDQVSQSIAFPAIDDHLVDSNNSAPDFGVSASASSGLAVSFASLTSAVCSVTSDGTVHLLGTGTCTIEASQPGDANFLAATPVDQSFRVVHALVMGPQAMEGNLHVAPGTTLSVGYDFTMPGSHPAANVTFTATSVVFQVACVGSSQTGTLTVPIAKATYGDPAGSPSWYPSGDQSSGLVYQGSLVVPDTICGPGVTVSLQAGGTFTTGITSTDTQDKVNVRWHYSANRSSGGWSGTTSAIPN